MEYKITIAKDEAEFDRIAAWKIIGQILNKPKSVIGLSTGKTTENMHAIISTIYRFYPFDTSQVTFFGLDEITNVPRTYKGACYTMLKNQLIDNLYIAEKNFIMPPTISDDFERECRQFQSAIEKRGGIDLQILGLGTNGHIGFNQPGTPFETETWISRMDDILEARVRKDTGISDKDLGGFTLGIKNIMQARKILLVAKGESKAAIVEKMLKGPITEDIPASIFQLHPDCEFLFDKAAVKYID